MYYLVFVTVISEGFTATVRLKTAVNLSLVFMVSNATFNTISLYRGSKF